MDLKERTDGDKWPFSMKQLAELADVAEAVGDRETAIACVRRIYELADEREGPEVRMVVPVPKPKMNDLALICSLSSPFEEADEGTT